MRWGDYDLDVDQDLVRRADTLIDLCEPWIDEVDRHSVFPKELLDCFQKSGIAELVVPARYGGALSEVDPLTLVVVRERLAARSPHLDALLSGQGLGSFTMTLVEADSAARRFLPGVAAGTSLASLALTEPDAGSDLKAITTTAEVDGDELVVSGHKTFISNAGVAAFYTALVREGDTHSFVVVPADTPGLSIETGPELIAPHILGDVTFDECRIPSDLRIGGPGQGWPLLLKTLSVFRASVAGAAVGMADAALDIAMAHTSRRQQFGRPLARLGPVAQLLAESSADVEMARLIAYRAGAKARTGPLEALGYSSMAKTAATEIACRVADRCIQVMGRFGLMQEHRVELIYRALRPMRIYEGATEVLRLGIAKEASALVGRP